MSNVTAKSVRSATIRRLRELDITQSEVCREAGLSRAAFTHWKAGASTKEWILLNTSQKLIREKVNKYERVLETINN